MQQANSSGNELFISKCSDRSRVTTIQGYYGEIKHCKRLDKMTSKAFFFTLKFCYPLIQI